MRYLISIIETFVPPTTPPPSDKPMLAAVKRVAPDAKITEGSVYGASAFYVVSGSSATVCRTALHKALAAEGFKDGAKGKFMGSGEIGLSMVDEGGKKVGGGRVFATFKTSKSMGEMETRVSIESSRQV